MKVRDAECTQRIKGLDGVPTSNVQKIKDTFEASEISSSHLTLVPVNLQPLLKRFRLRFSSGKSIRSERT